PCLVHALQSGASASLHRSRGPEVSMADEKQAPQSTPTAAAAPAADKAAQAKAAAQPAAPPPSMAITLLVALAPVLLGLTVGGFVVGPRLGVPAQPAAHAGSAAAPEQPSENKDKGKKGKDKEEPKPSLFKVSDIIINPAGSQGVHFLMTTVVFDCG